MTLSTNYTNRCMLSKKQKRRKSMEYNKLSEIAKETLKFLTHDKDLNAQEIGAIIGLMSSALSYAATTNKDDSFKVLEIISKYAYDDLEISHRFKN